MASQYPAYWNLLKIPGGFIVPALFLVPKQPENRRAWKVRKDQEEVLGARPELLGDDLEDPTFFFRNYNGKPGWVSPPIRGLSHL